MPSCNTGTIFYLILGFSSLFKLFNLARFLHIFLLFKTSILHWGDFNARPIRFCSIHKIFSVCHSASGNPLHHRTEVSRTSAAGDYNLSDTSRPSEVVEYSITYPKLVFVLQVSAKRWPRPLTKTFGIVPNHLLLIRFFPSYVDNFMNTLAHLNPI